MSVRVRVRAACCVCVLRVCAGQVRELQCLRVFVACVYGLAHAKLLPTLPRASISCTQVATHADNAQDLLHVHNYLSPLLFPLLSLRARWEVNICTTRKSER